MKLHHPHRAKWKGVDVEGLTQREAVYLLDDGQCIGCGVKVPRGGTSWQWQAHHVTKAQQLRRAGVSRQRIRSAEFVVLLCKRCHERHESRTEAVPFERLPDRVVDAVDALGTAAADNLRRYHPPS